MRLKGQLQRKVLAPKVNKIKEPTDRLTAAAQINMGNENALQLKDVDLFSFSSLSMHCDHA